MKIILFLSVMCMNASTLWSVSGEYMLRVSEIKNAYVQKDVQTCVALSKLLIREHRTAADAYFYLGRIYLERKYYRTALLHFTSALTHQKHFLIPEKITDLYFHLSATHYYMSNQARQMEALMKMKMIAEKNLQKQSSLHYEQALGEASFALGLIYYKKGDFYKARPYLLIALQNHFYEKISSLLLVYYYSTTPQSQINLALKQAYPKTLKTENRKVFFQFYYEQYKKVSITPIESDLMRHPWYRKMFSEVEFVFLQGDSAFEVPEKIEAP